MLCANRSSTGFKGWVYSNTNVPQKKLHKVLQNHLVQTETHELGLSEESISQFAPQYAVVAQQTVIDVVSW